MTDVPRAVDGGETKLVITPENLYNLNEGEFFYPLTEFSAPLGQDGKPMTNENDREFAEAKAEELRQSKLYLSVRIVEELNPTTNKPTGEFGLVLVDDPNAPDFIDEILQSLGAITNQEKIQTLQNLTDFLKTTQGRVYS